MSGHRPGETWRCSCGAQLIGAKTKAGRVAPIVYNASEEGNVLVFRGVEGEIEARTITGEIALNLLRREGVPLRLNHFADCKLAGEFRRAS